jgi:hypothetical protein
MFRNFFPLMPLVKILQYYKKQGSFECPDYGQEKLLCFFEVSYDSNKGFKRKKIQKNCLPYPRFQTEAETVFTPKGSRSVAA